MNNLIQKAAKLYRTASYCMARAELYLHEAGTENKK